MDSTGTHSFLVFFGNLQMMTITGEVAGDYGLRSQADAVLLDPTEAKFFEEFLNGLVDNDPGCNELKLGMYPMDFGADFLASDSHGLTRSKDQQENVVLSGMMNNNNRSQYHIGLNLNSPSMNLMMVPQTASNEMAVNPQSASSLHPNSTNNGINSFPFGRNQQFLPPMPNAPRQSLNASPTEMGHQPLHPEGISHSLPPISNSPLPHEVQSAIEAQCEGEKRPSVGYANASGLVGSHVVIPNDRTVVNFDDRQSSCWPQDTKTSSRKGTTRKRCAKTIRHNDSQNESIDNEPVDTAYIIAASSKPVAETGSKKRRQSATPTLPPQQLKKENLTEAEKRNNHVLSEQKRRNVIRDGFQRLVDLTPSLRDTVPNPSGPGNTGGNHSKSTILCNVANYIVELQAEVEALRNRLS